MKPAVWKPWKMAAAVCCRTEAEGEEKAEKSISWGLLVCLCSQLTLAMNVIYWYLEIVGRDGGGDCFVGHDGLVRRGRRSGVLAD